MERQPRLEDAETIRDGLDGGGPPANMPERFGPYRIVGRLGSGGMGEVFLAWDERLERRVAIKRIRQDLGLSALQRDRFRREARLAARLSHSAIVQVHDIVSEEPDDAIVMEYVEGRTLADLLRERLEMPEILRLAREIAEGLAAAHDEGLIHRDLKTANVIVTSAGHAKILDFGLARPVEREADDPGATRQGVILGTCYAMSPEQARGEELDQRSDLFSFGALVHEMLTGLPPFRGTEPFDSVRRVMTEEPVDPLLARPDLPTEAACLLRRLLQKDRKDRPANAREVVEVLERLRTWSSASVAVAPQTRESDLPTAASTTLELPAPFHQEPAAASSEKAPPWIRRHIFPVGIAAALLLAGAVGLYLASRSSRPLRVVVIPAAGLQEDRELGLAASAAETAALRGLLSLEKVSPIDSDQAYQANGSNPQKAQAASAEQILTIDLERDGGSAQLTLRRIDASSNEVLWIEQKMVPLGRENRITLAGAVIAQVQKGFSDHAPRLDMPGLDVRNEDYGALVEIQERLRAGEARREDLARLENMFDSSPSFVEAPVMAAQIAHSLFLSRREPADLQRASAFIRRARNISPKDPRMLLQDFQIALTRDRPGEAEAVLEIFEQLEPGDPDILPLRADLAEQQGDLDKAAVRMAEAVEQVPSWQNRYRLANLEARRNRINAAREQIEAILMQSPDNIWAQEALGNLELNYGGLSRAEEIYRKLVDPVPERAYGNLATIQALSGRFQEAAVFYRKALEAQPEHVPALINLAEVKKELGLEREAEDLYRRALDRLRKSEADASPTPVGALLKAQCLARLGRGQEAIAIAREQIHKNPEDAGLRFQAALVYSLAGEKDLALEQAKAALDRGIQPRLFTGSPFRWLRETPELRSWFQKTR